MKEGRAYTAAGEVSLVTRQAWVSSAWSTAGTTSLAYDAAGQVTKVTHIKSGSAVASYVYSYDSAGRLSSEVINGTSRTYSYDATGQLTADAGTVYGYDANGNRNTSGYATGAANRMSTDGTWTYTYDAEGNVTKRSKGASSDTWVYTYDHRNQLVGAAYSATDGGAVTTRVTNSYDAWGNKVQRAAWDGSTTTTERYAVDGWDPAKDWAIGVENFDTWADLNGSNAITLRRGFGPGFDELSWRQTSGGTAGWYLTDRLGSVRGVTNSTGTPLTTLTYSGWGVVLSNSTPAQSDAYQFTGRPTDPATGLRDHRSRVSAGNQWLQEDPSGLAPDVNNRRYVGNSPTNYTDPSGRSIINFTGTDTAGGSVTGPAGNLPTTGGMTGQDALDQAGVVMPPDMDPGAGLVSEMDAGLGNINALVQQSCFRLYLSGMILADKLQAEKRDAELYALYKEQEKQRLESLFYAGDPNNLGTNPVAGTPPKPPNDPLRTFTDFVGYASIVLTPLSIVEAGLELIQGNRGAAALAMAGVVPFGKPLRIGGEILQAEIKALKAERAGLQIGSKEHKALSNLIEQKEAQVAAAAKAAPATPRPGWNEPWTPPPGWNGPVNHGGWSGPKGNSNWIDTRPEVIKIVGVDPVTGKANPIPFYKGQVDFSKWSKGELTVPGLKGTKVDSAGDMKKIYEAIAKKEGLPNPTASIKWLQEKGLSPHHAGGDKIQLVPRGVHKVQHTDPTH